MASYLDKDGLKAVWSRVVTQTYDILQSAYPVGSIYMSMKPTSPASFIGGTWEQIQGKFLLGADSTYAAGSTGGEATHTLTVDEMPSHRHPQVVTADVASPETGVSGRIDWNRDSGENVGLFTQGTDPNDVTTQSVGGNKPHNNMPPYLVVYMWRRTA